MNLVGRPVPRERAGDKATGAARYTADLRMEPMLYGALVRSRHHHALLREIASEAAVHHPGVLQVITSADVPSQRAFGPMIADKPVLANGKVRHLGEAIALVVAGTPRQAIEAARLVHVEYEPLPSVHTAPEALHQGAPKIHQGGNLLTEYAFGDPQALVAVERSPVVLHAEFSLPRIAPAYLEIEAAQAEYVDGGRLRIWAGTQMPFLDRQAIAQVLGIEEERIEVLVPCMGGSFGGKQDSSLSLIAALGAWLTQSNLRIQLTREESMLAHPKRHPIDFVYQIGADKDGTLLAASIDALLDTGAYASYGPVVGGIIAEIAQGPYRIPHVEVRSKVIYTNNPPCGAVRGVGGPQAAFACESMMDMLAAELCIDPLELRRRNVWRDGDRTHFGVPLSAPVSLSECLEVAAEARKRLEDIPVPAGKQAGVGVALSLLKTGIGIAEDRSRTEIEWSPAGDVIVGLGSPDVGQGLRTVAAQMVAEELGLSLDRVDIAGLSTAVSPESGATVTSRTTFLVGNSLRAAASDAIQTLVCYAASVLSTSEEDIEYLEGKLYGKEAQDWDGTGVEIITSRAAEADVVLRGIGDVEFPPLVEVPTGLPAGFPHYRFCYGANVARVLVDPQTGLTEVSDLVAIHDVGRAINPQSVEGQIEGGVVMGLGYALMEVMMLKQDGGWTDNFLEYLIPTTLDAPHIEVVILECADPEGPFGARGIGEPAAVAAAPAIANAIFYATGKRISRLPIQPEDLLV